MTEIARNNLQTLKKTGSYYVMHITVAALVAYAVTGDPWMSLTLSLLEPSVQAVAFFFHEKAWQRHSAAQHATAAATAHQAPAAHTGAWA